MSRISKYILLATMVVMTSCMKDNVNNAEDVSTLSLNVFYNETKGTMDKTDWENMFSSLIYFLYDKDDILIYKWSHDELEEQEVTGLAPGNYRAVAITGVDESNFSLSIGSSFSDFVNGGYAYAWYNPRTEGFPTYGEITFTLTSGDNGRKVIPLKHLCSRIDIESLTIEESGQFNAQSVKNISVDYVCIYNAYNAVKYNGTPLSSSDSGQGSVDYFNKWNGTSIVTSSDYNVQNLTYQSNPGGLSFDEDGYGIIFQGSREDESEDYDQSYCWVFFNDECTVHLTSSSEEGWDYGWASYDCIYYDTSYEDCDVIVKVTGEESTDYEFSGGDWVYLGYNKDSGTWDGDDKVQFTFSNYDAVEIMDKGQQGCCAIFTNVAFPCQFRPLYTFPTKDSTYPVTPYLLFKVSATVNGVACVWYYRVSLKSSTLSLEANSEYNLTLTITGPGGATPNDPMADNVYLKLKGIVADWNEDDTYENKVFK